MSRVSWKLQCAVLKAFHSPMCVQLLQLLMIESASVCVAHQMSPKRIK